MKALASLALVAALAAPSAALAWGSAGHRIIGEVAMRSLPAEAPAFLRTPQAALDVGEYSCEPDRSKGGGKVHDSDRDPGHFIDLGDDGTIFGGPRLAALPPTRADYEKALQAVGQDSWFAGYLPYSIVDRWQQLVVDFAYWRVLTAAQANPAWSEHRDFFDADRRRREEQLLIDIGQLSHFVGDGSQPLHVTWHYNGWGDHPNPNHYTLAHIHGPFEGDLVRSEVREDAVMAQMPPPQLYDGPIEAQVAQYLSATGALVEPLYQLERAGGLQPGDPRGAAFATRQLAIGGSQLRDLILEAWRASDTHAVGWKPVVPADVEAGRVDPYPGLYGVD